MATVELQGVTKDWGEAIAVDAMDLGLSDGEFAAILGPSGCGKSTTLFMLAGIYEPTSGDILFDRARVNDVEARDRNVGIVFQSYALYPNMNVLKNILFPLRFKDVPRSKAVEEARQIADLVQISDLLERRPNQLSGGQQQRVALARALVKRPNLLLLDEPLSNLDATLRLTMRTEIRRIQRDLGVTTILVTHDQIEATTMADRIICMNKGRIEQLGSADALYNKPDTVFVASFIGSPPMNLLHGRAEHAKIKAGNAIFASEGVSSNGDVICGIRPELLKPGERGLDARISAVEPMGREILYTAVGDAGLVRFLEPAITPAYRLDEEVKLCFDQKDTLVFDAQSGQRIEGARFDVI